VRDFSTKFRDSPPRNNGFLLTTATTFGRCDASNMENSVRYVFIASTRKDMQLSIATYSQLSIAISKTHPVDHPAITAP
jgi:hypothetical protein